MNKIKEFIVMTIVCLAFLLITGIAKANDKLIVTTGHVVSETIKGTDIDISYIMEKELEAIAHKFMIDSISILQNYLPAILDGVAADLRLQADKKYKESLLNADKDN